jgi:hypothetical protein
MPHMGIRPITVLLVLAAGCAAQPASESKLPETGPLPEANYSTIGYPSYQVALDALRNKPGAEFRTEQGWTIVKDKEEEKYVIWSFTPPGYAAHPAVAKRIVFEKEGAVWVDLKVHCEASKTACDQFVRDFQQQNDRAKEFMQRRGKQ